MQQVNQLLQSPRDKKKKHIYTNYLLTKLLG